MDGLDRFAKSIQFITIINYLNLCDTYLLLNRKVNRRYGVIECDPLVRDGLDRTVS
jgi:hypothetical protein